MQARRPLTEAEEHRLVAFARTLPPRDRALITAQLFSGFRIAAVLSLILGQVYRQGRILPQIGVAPRRLKGKRGATRWVPAVPELERALQPWADALIAELGDSATKATPLLPAARAATGPKLGALGTCSARNIIKRVCATVAAPGRTARARLFARKVFVLSDHALQMTRAALGHTSICVTERHLEGRAQDVHRLVLLGDWTRAPRKSAKI